MKRGSNLYVRVYFVIPTLDYKKNYVHQIMSQECICLFVCVYVCKFVCSPRTAKKCEVFKESN